MSVRVSVRRAGVARWAAVVAVAATVVGTFGTHRHQDPPGPVVLGVVLAALAVLPVLIEVTSPVGLLASGVLTAAYFAAGYADGPVFLAIPAAALVDRAATWRRQWLWAAVAAALGVAGLWARDAWHGTERPTGWQSIGLVAMVAAATSLATALRSRHEAAAEQARSTASEERLRMAVELHDGVGHGLAVVSMQAGVALHMLDKDPASVRANLEAIRTVSHESLELLRGQLSELTGTERAPRAPAPGLSALPALVSRVRSGGLDVHLSVPADTADISEAAGRVVYAVAQEGLTNVLRHAAATQAEVTLRRLPETLVVTVADNGRGVASREVEPGLGIAGLQSRVADLGGTLRAAPSRNGFVVEASIPSNGRATS